MARLGNDEFALVLNVRDEGLLRPERYRTRRGRSAQKCFRSKTGASVGVAVVGASGTTSGYVLARADDACYSAKARGRDRWQFAAELPAGPGRTAVQLVADLATVINEGALSRSDRAPTRSTLLQDGSSCLAESGGATPISPVNSSRLANASHGSGAGSACHTRHLRSF